MAFEARVGTDHHTAVRVRDLEKVLAFYQQVVGLKELRRNGDPARPTAVFLPAIQLVRAESQDVAEKGVDVAHRLADTLVGPGLREVDPAEVPGLIADHDVVLVPSRREPYGLVAAEAIASGRWVVASRVGGLAQIVTDGTNGTLVSDGDFAAALAAVPDYDPDTVAATAAPFSVERFRDGMRDVWARVLAR